MYHYKFSMFVLQQIEEEREVEEEKEGVAIAKAPTHVDVLTAPTRRGIRSIYSEVQRTQSSPSSDSSDITCTGRFFNQLPVCTPNYQSKVMCTNSSTRSTYPDILYLTIPFTLYAILSKNSFGYMQTEDSIYIHVHVIHFLQNSKTISTIVSGQIKL